MVSMKPSLSSFRVHWRRLAARAGIIALLIQVVMPVHGFAAASASDGRVPICTAAGIVWQALDGAPTMPPPGTDRAGADCPFCLMHGVALVLPARVAAPSPVFHVVTALQVQSEELSLLPPFHVPPVRGPPLAA